jgi:hypothetical protein
LCKWFGIRKDFFMPFWTASCTHRIVPSILLFAYTWQNLWCCLIQIMLLKVLMQNSTTQVLVAVSKHWNISSNVSSLSKFKTTFHNKHFQSVVLVPILTIADVRHACVQTWGWRDLWKKENSKTKIAHLSRIHKISFKSIFNIIFM